MKNLLLNTTLGVNLDWTKEETNAIKTGWLVFSEKFTGKSLSSVINNANEDIGVITYRNSSQIQLFFNPEMAREAILELGFLKGVDNGANEYKSFPAFKEIVDGKDITRVRITQDDVDDMIERIKLTNLEDDENILRILIDLNIVYRMYQEKTIDAAKKAIEVEIKVALKKYKALSLRPYVYNFDWELKQLIIKRDETTSKSVELFADSLSLIQDSCKNFLIETANLVAASMPNLSDDEIKRFMKEPKNAAVSCDVRKVIKPAYNAISSDLAEMKQRAEKLMVVNKDEAERISHEATLLFKDRIEILSIAANTMLSDLTDEEKCNVLQYVAFTDKFLNVKKDSKSKMAFSVMQEEMLTMILNNYAEVTKAGYKIIVAKEDIIPGEIVFFENGKSDDGSYFDFGKEQEYSTGFFEIIEEKGHFYAVQDIEFNTDRGQDIAFSVVNPNMDAFSRGEKITIDQNGKVILDGNTAESGLVVGKVQGETARYLDKLTNKTGVVKDVVFIKREYSNIFLVRLTDVKEVVVDERPITDIAYTNDFDIVGVDGLDMNLGMGEVAVDTTASTNNTNADIPDIEEFAQIEDFDF